jgi:SWI/SNF-related matrix-associated actin-dependent regulator 1 of chromatin subfamily A
MKITREGDRFIAISTFAEKDIPKSAGFRWDRELKAWCTGDRLVAAKLADYADDTCREELAAAATERTEALAASRAVDADIDVPCPEGLEYRPYQRAGIAFASARPASLIADQPGLGKTIQAVGVINLDPTIRRILIVCPASLKANWAIELRRWLTRDLTIGIAASRYLPKADIAIANYDILTKLPLDTIEWDLLVADECHLAKNPKAKRTKALFAIKARRRLLLTGTPIVNRPIELWPLISYLDPETWPKASFMKYAFRYCAAKRGYGNHWDFSGASHLDELQEKLRTTIMIRRLKSEVLTELPPKIRQIVTLPADGLNLDDGRYEDAYADVESAEAEVERLTEGSEDYAAAVAKLKSARKFLFEEMARVRHDTAVAKIPYAIEHLREALDDDRKVVVFAHHHAVIEALGTEFGREAVTIYGGTKVEDRQDAVERFQADPSCRLFIGSIGAAGVGLTLTASSHVVFVELSWVPGEVSQAEDRLHRITQRNSVLVQHLVFDGSLDAKIVRTIVRKQSVIDAALDLEAKPLVIPAATEAEGTPTGSRQAPSPAEIAPLPAEQVAAIHAGLQILAARCDGALKEDGAGFNKLDSIFGHSLARAQVLTAKQAHAGRKLVRKYQRQLSPELVALAVGGPASVESDDAEQKEAANG